MFVRSLSACEACKCFWGLSIGSILQMHLFHYVQTVNILRVWDKPRDGRWLRDRGRGVRRSGGLTPSLQKAVATHTIYSHTQTIYSQTQTIYSQTHIICSHTHTIYSHTHTQTHTHTHTHTLYHLVTNTHHQFMHARLHTNARMYTPTHTHTHNYFAKIPDRI